MRRLCEKLFESSHFETGIKISPFSPAHIVYLILIFGGIFVAWRILRHKDSNTKEKALRFLAYALVFSYLSDFFFHEFVYDGLNQNKLPFHICTVLCPLVAIAQFNRNGKKILEPVAMLSILAPMMYLSYPASVGSGEPWCYQALQTMFYHGVLLAWGILNVSLGVLKPTLKKSWQSAVLLVSITLWATLGNSMMPDNNWFFLEEDALYIGLVSDGIIPQWSLLIINPIVFFLAVLATYGVCYAVKTTYAKKNGV